MPRKKIGVALGGGTMRGMTHIGVLEVFQENNLPIHFLVGCSSGAIVAAAYACGKMKELKETVLLLKNEDRRKMLDLSFSGGGLIKGEQMRSLFEYLTGGKKFEDIGGLKLAFVGTDALTGNEVVIDSGSIAEALEMTTALPGIAPLKRYQGRLVFDGGTAMLVPAKVAYSLGAENVIGVDVSVGRSVITRMVGDFRKMMRKSTLRRVLNPVFKMGDKALNSSEEKFFGKVRNLMKKVKLLDDYEKHKFNFFEAYLIGLRAISADYKKGLFLDSDCDIAIRPDVLHFKRSDVSHTKKMIEEGRKAAEGALGEIRKLLL
ncbi:MAG: patatin-like phospholipase family protein [Candidatus Moranbacteria bacterium]|nr:patatin-like phospholipase family protein [Candidatus Moranbacteria bacterium]